MSGLSLATNCAELEAARRRAREIAFNIGYAYVYRLEGGGYYVTLSHPEDMAGAELIEKV